MRLLIFRIMIFCGTVKYDKLNFVPNITTIYAYPPLTNQTVNIFYGVVRRIVYSILHNIIHTMHNIIIILYFINLYCNAIKCKCSHHI